jgi:hypothetical protein
MRSVLAIMAGLVGAALAFVVIGVVGVGATYAPPAGTNLGDSGRMVEILVAMPGGAKVALLVATLGAAIAGAALAKLVAGRAWPAWAVAGLLTCYAALSILSLPVSALGQALAIAAPLVGGLIGNHLVAARGIATDSQPDA